MTDEDRLRVAVAERLQLGEDAGQVEGQVVRRQLGVQPEARLDQFLRQGRLRDLAQPGAEVVQVSGIELKAGGALVAAAAPQEFTAGGERLEDMEALDAPRRSPR